MKTMFSLLFACASFLAVETHSQSEKKFYFEFETECGSPVVESQIYAQRTGRVTRIVNGGTIKVRDTSGKSWTVKLAGAEVPMDDHSVRPYLAETVLNKIVTFTGNQDKKKRGSTVEAKVVLPPNSDERLDITRHLLETGLARYKEPKYDYAVSAYWLCVLAKVEEKARAEGIGIWASGKTLH